MEFPTLWPKLDPRVRTIYHLALITVLGLGVLACGIILTRRYVPEWRPLKLSSDAFYLTRFERLPSQLGVSLISERPRLDLLAWPKDLGTIYQLLKDDAPDWIEGQGRAVAVEIDQLAVRVENRDRSEGRLKASFSAKGQLLALLWEDSRATIPITPGNMIDLAPFVEALRANEEELELVWSGGTVAEQSVGYIIRGANPPEYILGTASPGIISVYRSVGTERHLQGDIKILKTGLFVALPYLLVFLVSGAVAVHMMLVRRRAVWQLGLILALGSLIFSVLPLLGRDLIFWSVLTHMLIGGSLALVVFFLWVAVHSLFDEHLGERTRGWIHLWKQKRLTYRVGAELMSGLALGLVLAGAHLILCVAAVIAPGVWPWRFSVLLQDPTLWVNPFARAAIIVGVVLMALVGVRKMGWGRSLSVLLAGSFLTLFSPWDPWYFALPLMVPIAALLILPVEWKGLLGGLAAALTWVFLPLGLFAAHHPSWLLEELLVSAIILGFIVITGVTGLARSEELQQPQISMKIFVSYAQEDIEFAKRLSGDLSDRGAEVFLAERKMSPGQNLVKGIEEAISGAQVFIAVLSPAAVGSRWVQLELGAALTREVEGERLQIIAVLLADCEVPLFLRNLIFIDFRDPESYYKKLEMIVRAIDQFVSLDRLERMQKDPRNKELRETIHEVEPPEAK